MIQDFFDTLRWRFKQLWLLLRYLPILKCPACRGKGGDADYYGEFCECWYCEESWFETDNCGMGWTVGRVSPWRWLWIRFEGKTGHRTLTGWALCRLGYHDWMDESDIDPGLHLCRRCYEPMYKIVEDEPANETV